jgi:hypothetical protein
LHRTGKRAVGFFGFAGFLPQSTAKVNIGPDQHRHHHKGDQSERAVARGQDRDDAEEGNRREGDIHQHTKHHLATECVRG